MNRFYTTGEFARKARVTIRTIRYYDKQGILKPSIVTDAGYRLYSDEDFGRLQKILSLKSLGFSLQEIMNITMNEDSHDLEQSFMLQLKLLQRKLGQLQLMEQSIRDSIELVRKNSEIDWNGIIKLIHISNMDRTLVEQYKNETNLNIRIKLHEEFSVNKTGWFPWLYQQIIFPDNANVLELGCGNGKLWLNRSHDLQKTIQVTLTDISQGMIADAKRNIEDAQSLYPKDSFHFAYDVVDCEQIPYPDDSFDIVIANHLLFYVNDINYTLREVKRVLKKGGTFYCSTYGSHHMEEITQLVKEFDPNISLSEVPLYELFGLQNGRQILSRYFAQVQLMTYEDELRLYQIEPLIQYIMSCHGNQNDILLQERQKFKEFLTLKLQTNHVLKITKEAGVFIARLL